MKADPKTERLMVSVSALFIAVATLLVAALITPMVI